MIQVDEKKLVADCIAHDIKAKKMLYELYAGKMFMVCMRYANNREDAEDILQDSFMKIFDNISKYRNEGSFEGWVKRIAANTAIKHYYKKNPMYPVTSIENIEETEEEDSFMDKLSNDNSMQDLLEMIRNLAPRYRMVFNLYAIDGHSHSEIAQLLNISEGTSKSQLSRAREVLKNQIKEKQKFKEQEHVSR
jgi:RNA polymerase sigma factor (sigma-70 family)